MSRGLADMVTTAAPDGGGTGGDGDEGRVEEIEGVEKGKKGVWWTFCSEETETQG